MTELRQLFFESAGELVQKLNDEALRLEKAPGDAETARSLRRTVHTLKGDSAACGFRELSELAHEFEDVLTLGNTAAAALVPEIALRAADVFRPCWRRIAAGRSCRASGRCARTLRGWRIRPQRRRATKCQYQYQ